jgi:DNA-binding CsgD family transcriptional regulator
MEFGGRNRSPAGCGHEARWMVETDPGLLAPLGVSELEERVYRALLATPDATRTQLAASARIRPGSVTAALRRLESLGLVSRTAGRPQRVVAVVPDLALESLVQAQEHRLLQVRAAVSELVEDYQTSRRDDPRELVQILTVDQAPARRDQDLKASCREELLLLDRPPYAAPPDNPEQAPVLRRGVRWRTLYAPESLERPGARAHVEALVSAGEVARVLPGLPLKLVVVDRRTALLPLTLDRALAQTAVIHRSTLLDAMVALFEVFWERAIPLGGTAPPASLTEQDRAVLSLLVSGAKDEAIARELGIGVRTLRRRMRHLMELLDAETRFQAGMQAVRRGWV